ncbi:MAG: ABC transporter substrate-binding protein [Thermoleophilaceae bacterium]
MRIASLVPSATETLFALGLGDDVVAVTHECDYPLEAQELPHLTRSVIPPGLSAAEIDSAVRERTQRGEAIYELDEAALRDAEPELIVTQALCPVCAVSVDDVRTIAEELPSQPQVLSLDPTTLGEVLADIRTLGIAAEAIDAAEELLRRLADRLDRVQDAVADAPPPPVATVEWLDPVYVGGHWVPQMVELAGGVDVLGLPGERSRVASWDEVRAAEPRIVVCMPCGYDLEGSELQVEGHPEVFEIGDADVFAVDASGHFSRPGPRLVDGVEVLAQIVHPDRVRPPGDPAWTAFAEAVRR